MPIRPEAPGLLSMRKAWPVERVISDVMARSSVSGVPPAADGTTMRTGRCGSPAACASMGTRHANASNPAREMRCNGVKRWVMIGESLVRWIVGIAARTVQCAFTCD